ncbi:BolA/IbaG family iron-sulfur metabolism protein [Allofrancisella guangzhouensis]|uniref:Cell division protein BolA n=1 Tax=Allofrancisella guangzhouensis TaxID=594679 RepID=A0A0A8E5W1_9GAMM|nr:BolA/IbaG family iron-sulfur metabolism protein [Allofrancisella guangzhouensis]AJC48987.1 cell division protein BolA [Allofrancisella guangzhouensis]MBK2027892.1 BolA/IbaG family iron-sulfur metabolism protein [Allofrancisella guangzhouensis]MBK2044145.1 BolA/IbaG family iron-sulfur metabolism protein [Allofrancisella guangzhouensis]MBK2045125.1 BolA/IbaG family iron-sulfur metabolism protein [Allofrancisella guangzhouensis]
MDISTLVDQIEQCILSKLDSKANIKISDETYKHVKHKSYTEGKYHLFLEIESNKLNSISKLSSHKQVYASLGDLMAYVHALSIKIKPEQVDV